MIEREIELKVNGSAVRVLVKPQDLLVDVLRDRLGLIGTKKGCGTGECGACTVLLDGRPVNACLILALRAQNKEILTIEGLGSPQNLHPLQESFIERGAVQCGFCAPGMLLAAKALLDQNPHPTEPEIRQAIAGNICRCTGYAKIVQAIEVVADLTDLSPNSSPLRDGKRVGS
jgi:carbon-monoxide dehydrogenase small subunit